MTFEREIDTTNGCCHPRRSSERLRRHAPYSVRHGMVGGSDKSNGIVKKKTKGNFKRGRVTDILRDTICVTLPFATPSTTWY